VNVFSGGAVAYVDPELESVAVIEVEVEAEAEVVGARIPTAAPLLAAVVAAAAEGLRLGAGTIGTITLSASRPRVVTCAGEVLSHSAVCMNKLSDHT
jgi:hypothetical protein